MSFAVSSTQVAALKRLHATSHPWAVLVKDMVSRADFTGQAFWFHLYWLMTTDGIWAHRAIAKALTEYATVNNRNDTREGTIFVAALYAELKGVMSLDERTRFRNQLKYWAELILDLHNSTRPWGTRLDDSDEVVGHHLGLLAIDRATSDDPEESVLDPLLSKTPGPQGTTMVAQRGALLRFLSLAEDGRWIESSMYNVGTLQLLLAGIHFDGYDKWSGAREMFTNASETEHWDFTPDYSQGVEWGDDEHPRTYELGSRVSLLSMLAGTGHDPANHARTVLEKIIAGRNPLDYRHLVCRALWFFDPSSSFTPAPSPVGLRVTRHTGMAVHRGPDHLVQFHAPDRLAIDHDVPYVSDLLLWYRGADEPSGEWVLDQPRGYLESPEGANGVLLSGLGSMYSRGPLAVAPGSSDSKVSLSTSTSGQYFPGVYWDPPPPFLRRYTRMVEVTPPARVVVTDIFDGDDPLKLPKADRWGWGTRELIDARLAKWDVFYHCPTEPTVITGGAEGFQWRTRSGRLVRVTGTGHQRTAKVQAAGRLTSGYYQPGETGGWMVRFLSDAPRATIVTTFEVVGVSPSPPSPPVPVPPPPVPVPPPPTPIPIPPGEVVYTARVFVGGVEVKLGGMEIEVRLTPKELT